MHHNQYGGALLADDMGLGKTVQVAVYLRCLHACDQIKTCLIITPSSVLQVWEDTLNEWTGRRVIIPQSVDLPVIVFHASKEIREFVIRETINSSFHILLTTYGMIRRHLDFFNYNWCEESNFNRRWDYIILDEGHKVNVEIAFQRRFGTATRKCQRA